MAARAADLPLLSAAGPIDVIDVSELDGLVDPGNSPVITPTLLLKWEEANGGIEAGDVVCFRSRWDDRYRAGDAGASYGTDVLVTKRSPGWPAPSAGSVELLRNRGVTCTCAASKDRAP